MKKVLILLMVALLVASGITAALAYTEAQVTNPLGLTVVNTDTALLAIRPNTGAGYNDATARTESGKLVLNFAAGNRGNFGFQPGSQYIFENLFYVKNNSSDSIKMGMRFDSVYPPTRGPTGLHTVSTTKAIPGWSGSYANALMHFNGGAFTGGWKEGRYIVLAPDEEIGITWDFNLLGISTVSGSENFSLQVFAQPISTPN